MAGKTRIDVHHHVVPRAYLEWLREKGLEAGGLPIPTWSEESALALMEIPDPRIGPLPD